MGDRGNIVVVDEGKQVCLYAHWSGDDLPSTLHRALAKRWRWTDGAYLTRIIFCEMVKGSEEGETGFGISQHMMDFNHPLIVVDSTHQTVGLVDANTVKDGECPVADKTITFEDFLKINFEAMGDGYEYLKGKINANKKKVANKTR